MLTRTLSLAVVMMVALTACTAPAPAPSAAPTTATSPTSAASTPTPTASADPVAVPAELVVSTLGVQLYDSEGTEIGAFAWADEATTALAVLEIAFGAPSATALVEGDGTHIADYETYTYSGGFTYLSATNLGKPRSEFHLPSAVQIDTGSAINGVTVRTTRDLRVGGTLAQVLALSPVINRPHPLGTVYLLDPVDPSVIGDPENSTDTIGVIVNGSGAIVKIISPWESNPL